MTGDGGALGDPLDGLVMPPGDPGGLAGVSAGLRVWADLFGSGAANHRQAAAEVIGVSWVGPHADHCGAAVTAVADTAAALGDAAAHAASVVDACASRWADAVTMWQRAEGVAQDALAEEDAHRRAGAVELASMTALHRAADPAGYAAAQAAADGSDGFASPDRARAALIGGQAVADAEQAINTAVGSLGEVGAALPGVTYSLDSTWGGAGAFTIVPVGGGGSYIGTLPGSRKTGDPPLPREGGPGSLLPQPGEIPLDLRPPGAGPPWSGGTGEFPPWFAPPGAPLPPWSSGPGELPPDFPQPGAPPLPPWSGGPGELPPDFPQPGAPPLPPWSRGPGELPPDFPQPGAPIPPWSPGASELPPGFPSPDAGPPPLINASPPDLGQYQSRNGPEPGNGGQVEQPGSDDRPEGPTAPEDEVPAATSGPKPSPNFLEPTNPPQLPPSLSDLPPGYGVRTMGPTEQYPNGYWVETNEGGQPIDPSTGKPPSNVSRAVSRSMTHVPLPPGG
jgi:hypothetical protein